MEPRQFLRLEGVAVLAVVLVSYVSLDGPLWLLAVLALAPDLSMLGYLAGPRIGSACYNVAHTYTLPLALGAAAVSAGIDPALPVALVWGGHIGADRALGYGLKFETGFKNTHLTQQPAPLQMLTENR